jgi:hypothetical protein
VLPGQLPRPTLREAKTILDHQDARRLRDAEKLPPRQLLEPSISNSWSATIRLSLAFSRSNSSPA